MKMSTKERSTQRRRVTMRLQGGGADGPEQGQRRWPRNSIMKRQLAESGGAMGKRPPKREPEPGNWARLSTAKKLEEKDGVIDILKNPSAYFPNQEDKYVI